MSTIVIPQNTKPLPHKLRRDYETRNIINEVALQKASVRLFEMLLNSTAPAKVVTNSSGKTKNTISKHPKNLSPNTSQNNSTVIVVFYS